MDFKAGDVVLLKADGRKMTVEAVSGTGVSCRWFDEADKAQVAEFPAHFLELDDGEVGDQPKSSGP